MYGNRIDYFYRKNLYAVQLNNPRTVELTEMETDLLTLTEHPYSLIVWNDEVNTFEWVIETLIDICHHTTEQAEQCAMIIHTRENMRLNKVPMKN